MLRLPSRRPPPVAGALLLVPLLVLVPGLRPPPASAPPPLELRPLDLDLGPVERVRTHVEARYSADLAALERHRPGYPFWRHVFLIPDGSIAYGSETDGRLLAWFPTRGDWTREGRWEDPSLARVLRGQRLPSRLDARRERVAELLEPVVGPTISNPTRGRFLLPQARRYGGFLEEWARIYERFGVPADLGLAQAAVESGLSGTIKSEARAVGFCQWLPSNWRRLQRLSPHTIEVENQTTQAAYCAAYLAVLGVKYGTFIPALSEHHAGAPNVGRAVINGARLGGADVREQYLVGGAFALDLRALSPGTYSDVLGTYGPRSYRYAEMVFANAATVRQLREETPQRPVFAMRAPRALPLAEVVRRSGLSAEEVKRYNPALARQVPPGAAVYLPKPVAALGPDVSFWHREAPPEFSALLDEFVRLDVPLERWEDRGFESVLEDYRDRFRATGCEEGTVMATVLDYVVGEMPNGRRILSDFRRNPRIRRRFEEGVRLRAQRDR